MGGNKRTTIGASLCLERINTLYSPLSQVQESVREFYKAVCKGRRQTVPVAVAVAPTETSSARIRLDLPYSAYVRMMSSSD